MNFKAIILGLLSITILFLSSCEKKPQCKSCSANQTNYEDGYVISTQYISSSQYCDDDLEYIEENPYVTVRQTVGTKTLMTTTSYSCN
ncbi:MAG: hypothetical protein GY810_12160 [Aureispira sp.]|nr:hypothetical protein [Aureispira sp.]